MEASHSQYTEAAQTAVCVWCVDSVGCVWGWGDNVYVLNTHD